MRTSALLLATASVAAMATVAQAQTAPPGALSTVVVTAEKREAALQETPISVTVLQARTLQEAGVHDIKDLAMVTPGLLVASTSNATYTTARIRGVGTVGDNPGLESSVGVVVDGVMRARNGVALTDLGELDRVEVLKGPQGTLFGKNTSAGVINVITARPSATFSQELRLAGTSDRLDWLVGGYYQNEDLDRHDRFLYGTQYESYLSLLLSGGASTTNVSTQTGLAPGSVFPAGQGYNDHYLQTEKSLAVFTHETLRLTDQLSLSAGLRYTDERKNVTAAFTNSDGGAGCAAAQANRAPSVGTLCLPWSNPAFNNLSIAQNLKEGEWTGSAQALYRASGGVNLYAGYSRGFKSGGFNLDRSQTGLVPDRNTSFAGEFVDDYEAGAKTSWMGGALLVNAAVFEEDFQNFQLNTFLGTTFTVRSIPKVTAKGVDADFLYRTPVEGLTLQGGVVHAETQYGPAAVPGLPLLSGSRLSFAPLWSASLAGTLERPLANGLTGRASVEMKYSSSYNTGSDLDPLKIQTGFALVNARLGLGAADGRWRVELWAQNLFDQRYYQVAFGAPFQTGTIGAFLGPPRTLGATLRVRTN